jgi:hypothetical protein
MTALAPTRTFPAAGLLAALLALPALAQEAPEPAGAAAAREVPAQEVSPQEASAQEGSAGEPPLTRVELEDGQVLVGRVVRQDAEALELRLASGAVLTVPARAVRSTRVEEGARVNARGEVQFADPNRTRYFYSPSAMTLKAGEMYVSQKELVYSSFAFGVTDHLTLVVGSALPFWFSTNGSGINVMGGAKLGFQPVEGVHVAAAVESVVLPLNVGGPQLLGLGSVVATVGGRDAHLSLNVGAPLLFASRNTFLQLPPVIATLSGNLRVHRHVALVSENWFVPGVVDGSAAGLPDPPRSTFGAAGFGVRLMGERLAVDVGAVVAAAWTGASFNFAPFPVPWLDFTYNFG